MMACMQHDWFYSSPCPSCAQAAAPSRSPPPEKVTAPVTAAPDPPPPPAPYIEPAYPMGPPAALDIPPELQRRDDGGWVFPSLHQHVEPKKPSPLPMDGDPRIDRRIPREFIAPKMKGHPVDIREWSPDQLRLGLVSAQLMLIDRQPLYREVHRRDDLERKRLASERRKEEKGLL